MRFLVFNVVVAAALVYLFTADRADIHAAADKAYGVAETVRAKAGGMVASLRDGAAEIEEIEDPVPDVPEIAASAKPTPASVAARPAPPEPPAAPPPPPEPELVPAATPEVAARRAEVLAVSPVRTEVRPADEGAPAAIDRRRDLHRLAEEMELFSAEAASR